MFQRSLVAVLIMLGVGGCATQDTGGDYAPILSSLRSEFISLEKDGPLYRSYLAATQAQQDEQHKKSAAFFLEALRSDPTSQVIADKAFFELLLAGHLDAATALAENIATDFDRDENDLVRLMYVLQAYKNEDWPAVRDRLANQKSDGFSYIFAPLLTAWSYAAEGNFPAAETALTPFNDDKRLKPLAQEHAAYMLDYLGEYDAARVRYEQVTSEMPPVSLQPVVAYAHLLYRHGEKKLALSFLAKQALRFDSPPFLLRQGRVIAGGGTPNNIATTPIKAGGAIFFRLANELSQGRAQKAAILYARIASYLTPEHSNIHILLARLLERAGNVNAAADALAQVGETNEARGYADIRRVEVLQAAGKNKLAEKLSRELLIKAPRNPQLLLGLGDLLRLRQADAEALVYYSRAIASLNKPNELNWVAYFARAMAYEKLGDWQRAEHDLKAALNISPEEPALLNYLGYSWIERGTHIPRAKAMIEKAAAIKPDDGFITDSLGWVYFLTADYGAAVITLEKAVRLEPGDVTINDHLGDAYWKVGRQIEARFQWRHALDSGAKDKERALILAKLDAGLLEAS
ncbi:MAG: hypothetical protein COB37_12320 [Kordiimonadales bacterium]|nr:MAG: hypothetical protein COB37_12320 [Kordiimonadales bacterium]